jgi:hypothetical protein
VGRGASDVVIIVSLGFTHSGVTKGGGGGRSEQGAGERCVEGLPSAL